jgi:hypothetical protein
VWLDSGFFHEEARSACVRHPLTLPSISARLPAWECRHIGKAGVETRRGQGCSLQIWPGARRGILRGAVIAQSPFCRAMFLRAGTSRCFWDLSGCRTQSILQIEQLGDLFEVKSSGKRPIGSKGYSGNLSIRALFIRFRNWMAHWLARSLDDLKPLAPC